jgi:hypothetical protein
MLRSVAADSSNVSLAPAFAAFAALPPAAQSLLIDSITVLDAYPDVMAIEASLLDRLRLSVRTEHRRALLERLEGWWFGRVVRLLRDHDLRPIPIPELLGKVYSIAEQFRPDALPIDFLDALPIDNVDPHGDKRRFVLQMRAIAAGSRRIEKAIIDYYRAFEQRSRWAREELLPHFELEQYEAKLVDEWERRCDALREATPPDTADEDALRHFGKQVFNWMEQEADVRIRDNVREEYVMRGSYHILADQDPVRVWWHPLFVERLSTLLASASSQQTSA